MIRKATGWLVAGVMAAAMAWCPAVAEATPAPSVKDLTVRAMSYNVNYSGSKSQAPKTEQPWTVRGPAVASWMRWNHADVVGFQENNYTKVNGKSARQMTLLDDERLPDYQWVGAAEWTVPIAVRRAKFTVGSSGISQISWKGKGGSKFNRWLSWAFLTDRATGRQLLVLNTHLEPYTTATSAKVRAAQATRLVAKLRQLNPGLHTPFVVLGDYNFDEHKTGVAALPRNVMTEANLTDGATIAMRRDDEVPNAQSYNGYGKEIDGKFRYKVIRQNNWHYDYTWVPLGARVNSWKVSSGPNTVKVKIGGKPYMSFGPGPLPSDHSPVVASITYPGNLTIGDTSATLGGLSITGGIYRRWLATGGEKGLGLPQQAATKVTEAGVVTYRQRFANGEVLWSSKATDTFWYPAGPNFAGIDNDRDALAPNGMKRGVLYRSAAIHKASAATRSQMAAVMAGGTIVDLRDTKTSGKYPDPKVGGVTNVNVPLPGDAVYSRYVTEATYRAQIAKALRVAASSSGPVWVHCSYGRDRTGWVIASIMYAAGASDAVVRAEYVRSPGSKPAEFDGAVAAAKRQFGSLDGYLTAGLGLTSAEVSALKVKFS